MSDDSTTTPPRSFWIAGGVCLVWNLLGGFAYLQETNPDALAAMPAAHQTLVELRPAWATGAFAIAVWGGVLGCILLLLRKAIALYVFAASLLGVVVQMYFNYAVGGSVASYGPGAHVMSVMILGIAIFLIWYTKQATSKGWVS